ncbi:MAG: hypothetical protein FJ291_22720 [Planctomycetes bacterium]|nr:hypothetical protein [Planctomycetota bacterium]
MKVANKGTTAGPDARKLLEYFATHEAEKKAIADAAEASEAAKRIRHLPREGARLIFALADAGRGRLERSPTEIPELKKVADWVLSWKAPLELVAEQLRPFGLALTPRDMYKNPVGSISSHCTYHIPGGIPLMHVEFRDPDDNLLFENVEPVPEVAKTARNLLQHVALVYQQLKEAGCSMEWLEKDDDLETLGKSLAAIHSIAKARGISFRSVMQKAKKVQGTPPKEGESLEES